MAQGRLNIALVVWGFVCLALSVVWVVVWPSDRAVGAEGVRLFLIRWGHTFVWALLAAMCLFRASGNPTLMAWGGPLGLSALGVYLAFLGATLVR